jgi:hypothetical protein
MFLTHNSTIGWIFAACIAIGLPTRSDTYIQNPLQQSSPPSTAAAPSRADGATTAIPQTHKTLPRKKKKTVQNPNCVTTNTAPDAPPEAAKDCPPVKVVVRNGGTSERALHLSGANDDAHDPHRGQSTDQLLQSTGRNLQQLSSRQLAPAEKEMVDQILRYSEQSRAAVAAGDVELGHNFALKAHLLSDELLTH